MKSRVGGQCWMGGRRGLSGPQAKTSKVLTWFQITVGELVSKFTVQVE